MRLTNNILYGQTLLDMTIQELGDLERLFELAVDNDVAITDDLETETQLIVGDADSTKRSLVLLFSNPASRPASADVAGEVISKFEGIGYWYIDNDFIVS